MWGLFGRRKKVDDSKKKAASSTVIATPVASMPATAPSQSASSVSSSSTTSSKPTVTVVSGPRKELPTASTITALQRKETRAWTVDEVGFWLEHLELGEYTKQFADNSIAGADLLDLEDEDLLSINVRKLGHRKKILAKIRHMKASGAMSSQDDDARSSHSANSHTDNSTHSSNAPSGTFILKCDFEGDVVAIKAKQDLTLADLNKKIKKEFGKTFEIKYVDKDGDVISISKDDHLTTVLKSSPTKTIKLQLSEKKVELGAAQTSVLENLVDGVVIIDSRATILYVNKAMETMFGYSREEVVNKNVNILMTSENASVHDSYIKRYLQTGEGRIIGLGRDVEAKKKNGSPFNVYLTLSETKNSKQHTFTGLIRESTTKSAVPQPALMDASVQFSILENILDACVVCDEKGIVQFFNRRATEMLGFSNIEIMGKNVKNIMPAQYAEEHDKYIAQYVSSGKAKIIGIGRDVVAQKKDGSFLPINLSVTEQYFAGGRRLFTGILREFEERSTQEKSVLQQEREVLDNLIVPAIIIGEKGNILAVNAAALTLLGYTMIELINKNVKVIMTPTDAAHHDAYLATYLRTNKARVLGIGRDVVAQRKNGTLVNVRLSVTEKLDEQDKRLFTGIIQKI